MNSKWSVYPHTLHILSFYEKIISIYEMILLTGAETRGKLKESTTNNPLWSIIFNNEGGSDEKL